MSTSMSAGVAWAVPVQPELLGEHLDAFIATLPKIHALRMCHRFGRGVDVHVTKLPVEIEQAIEELIVESWDSFDPDTWSPLGTWDEQFECFESRCEPMGHLMDANSPLSDQASDNFTPCKGCEGLGMYEGNNCKNYCKAQSEERCEECKSGPDPDLCERSCIATKRELKNELAMEWDWYDAHVDARARWLRRIDQKNDGGFVKHAEVLRKEFGLAAFFSNTRVADGEKGTWPHDSNYRYHSGGELQTTICYLTLPGLATIEKKYLTSEMEDECGYVGLPAAHAMEIQLPDLTDEARIRTRFQRALRILGLEPYVHPSHRELSLPPQKSVGSVNKDATGEAGTKKVVYKLYPNKAEWPRLLLLVRTTFSR